jgi:very-short-patch-repair endonuclease
MDSSFIGLLILVAIIVFIKSILSENGQNKPKIYQYTARTSPMTKAETEFFFKLDRVAGSKYYVFPQMHLSSILDHRVKGQEWKHAFSHINGKSVDYVLCDKTTLLPTYAIELDDYTHDRPKRKERDYEVNRMLHYAGIPLLRVKNMHASDDELINALVRAREELASSEA